MNRRGASRAVGLVLTIGLAAAAQAQTQTTEWKDWGGSSARMNYSAINQITADKVAGLKPVWV